MRALLALFLLLPPSAWSAEKTAKPVPPPPGAVQQSPDAQPVQPVEENSARSIKDREVDYSEFNYQAKSGEFNLIPITAFSSQTIEYKTVSYKTNYSVFTMGAGAEYGITDNIAVGAGLSYSSGRTSIEDCPILTTCTTERDRGMNNPAVETNFKLPVGPGAIRVEIGYNFSPDDHEVDQDGDENRFTGGSGLDGDLGYEVYAGRHVFGGTFATDLMLADRKVNDKTSTPNDYKVTGGEAWQVTGFYEFHLPKVVIGGSMYYAERKESKTESAGASTGNDDEISVFGMQVYVPVYLSNGNIVLLPTLAASSIDYKQSPTVKESSSAVLGFGTRFTF